MRIKSAVDFRNEALILSAVALILTGALYLTASMGFSAQLAIIGYVSAAAASAFLLWFLFGTYYELREDYMYCRCGPFAEAVRYDDIICLRLSKNTGSSLALSSKRIEVWQYSDGVVSELMISPKNRVLFIARLKARCRYLQDAA
ncbi:MAG: PH domain-containing protein [Clostridiales bacterium]|nr:PH domain-containing protein [Clostridiales bacterium]